ncbi:MAG: ECF-type sigma factor [Lysobacteraceae bacterium]
MDKPMVIHDAGCSPESMDSVTELLADAQAGRDNAWDRIYAVLYDDLHRIAHSQIRQRRFGRMSATSLVSEGWLRLASAQFSVDNRRHFMALVARAMRFVLMDEARKELADKRGDGQHAFSLEEGFDPGQDSTLAEMVALDAALTRLSRLDMRLAQLVEMRYFGGMDEDEIAASLGVTERTLRRDWRRARAFLLTQLEDAHPAETPQTSQAAPRSTP